MPMRLLTASDAASLNVAAAFVVPPMAICIAGLLMRIAIHYSFWGAVPLFFMVLVLGSVDLLHTRDLARPWGDGSFFHSTIHRLDPCFGSLHCRRINAGWVAPDHRRRRTMIGQVRSLTELLNGSH